MAPLLEVEDLGVEIGSGEGMTHAVRGASFAVEPGEMLGIVGGSGSGKSTTLRSIVRGLPREGRVVSGAIRYCGDDLLTLGEKRLREVRGAEIAMIVQSPIASLNPLKRVEDHIGGLLKEHRKPADRGFVIDTLRDVGIRDAERVARAYPHELSGGMAQRVMIATAVALGPRLILADEPTSALDVTIQAQILELLRAMVDEHNLAVILVTHEIALVAEHCERALVMNKGEVVEYGPTEQVIHAPGDEYTRRLIEAAQMGGDDR